MKKTVFDAMVVGFALFAMFFGAGNLIFPPYLGLVSGTGWLVSLTAFLFADGGLSLLGILAMTKVDGNLTELYSRAGKWTGECIGVLSLLCVGPMIAMPRTAATTYEIAVLPTIGSLISSFWFSILFFIVVLIFTIRPTKVVDYVGTYLTPLMLICLIILISVGILHPVGAIHEPQIPELFAKGLREGYQAMDAIASAVFAVIIIGAIIQKGYTTHQAITKMTVKAGIVALVGMAIVYGGLAYLGASGSSVFPPTIERTALLVGLTGNLLGDMGKIILAIIVLLACLTTSIGLASACGNYFSKITNGKLKYEWIVVIACVVSGVLANLSVDVIIKMASPVLEVLYPAVITFILLGMFTRRITNDNIFKFSVWCALICGLIGILPRFVSSELVVRFSQMVMSLPGGKYGVFWMIPVVVAGVIGAFFPPRSRATVPNTAE